MEKLTALEGALIADLVYDDLSSKVNQLGNTYDDAGNSYTTLSFASGWTTDLQMALLLDSAGNYIVAFRGTASIDDVVTDLQMGVSTYLTGLADQFTPAGVTLSRWINQYGLSVSNTTIVGHSLGGALAQYFGANTGFETLTYNAYGIGNEFSGGSYDNITNYVTMNDPVSVFPRSKMIGKTYMLQDENLTAALGHGISNFTSESSWVRGYSKVNSPHDIDVIDGIGNSAYELALMAIEGRKFATINGSLDDVIFGGEINNTLIGGGGKDTLYGMGGSDTLEGGKGNDTLFGGYSDKVDAFTDYLYGGEGDDTYYAGDSDKIKDDTTGEGSVYFEGQLLTGGISKNVCNTSHQYFGDGGVYTFSSGVLTFTKDGKILTIQNFKKTEDGYLSIILKDPKSDSCPHPVQPCFPSIPLPTPVQKVINTVTTYYNTVINYIGSSGGGGGGSSPSSTPHSKPTAPAPIYVCVNEDKSNSAGTGGGASGTGPIVLDLNRNGLTSISLAASTALFDYDGDGIKENTAWSENTDALLVNDVNKDGTINNATELFGNYTRNSDGSVAKSGYQALSYYDTNGDSVIDASDSRFEELSLWIDSNQDGVTDTGELKTLSEMGVTSLALHSATPYIATPENNNTIIQETMFTDGQGEGVMRDVLFRYENTTSTAEGVYFDMDANGIKEKMTTWTNPNEWIVVKDISGDGKINNGSEIVGNNMILNTGTTAADTIQALKTFDINHDGKVDTADNSGLAFWTDRNHNGLTDVGELEALGAAGAIQVIKLNPYQTLLSMYENGGDGVINSSDNLSNYLYIQTNADESITIYLPDNEMARDMIEGYIGGESIQTSQGEKIIKQILFYEGYEIDLNDTLNGTDDGETLDGSSRSETLRGKGGRDILDAGAGDDTLEGGTDSDKLIGGAGNDTYLYGRGDGKDLIVDTSGTDMLSFSAGITRDDLIIKSNGADISIYLKDGTKPLSQLTDQIIIKDWHTTGTVKTLAFSDGSMMDARDIVTMFSTDKNDTIYGTENSEILRGGKGNDVLQGRGGSDTYLYGRGDGKDTIIDSGGFDTLTFDAGISANDLIVKKEGNDIIIGVKENGVTFDNLSDTITLKNWYTAANRVERFSFAGDTTVNESWIIEMLDNVDDVIYGTDASEVFSTFGGDDTVYAGGGDDTLIGGKGNDTLNGEAGNNTIDGGVGDDSLFGGVNNDIYIFRRGYGKDIIQEATPGMAYTQGNDTLKFEDGIATADVIIKQIGNDLLVGLKEEGKSFDQLSDVVTMKDWSNNTTRRMFGLADFYMVENFVFSNGTIWNKAEIISHIGTDEDDVIYGSETNDILQGGQGNDSIYGLTGDDVYIFNRGDGQDTIYDTAQNYYSGGEYNSGSDVLKFGEEITADDLIIQKSGKNLIVTIKEDGAAFEALQDKVTLNNWFSANNRIETFIFSDGSTMDTAFLLNGTDGDDYITFGTDNNTVYASNGNDAIYAGGGNDTIYGEAGKDSLYGETGNDILDGGVGDDKLYGGAGNDIYIFGRGYGKDILSDIAGIDGNGFGIYGGNDTLKFSENITPEDITIIQSGNNLLVGIKEEGKTFNQLNDVITLTNWSNNHEDNETAFNSSLFERYGIENFSFSDGTTWKTAEIVAHIGTDGNDTIYGIDLADTLHGGKGDDILYGRQGKDTYLFNRGDGKDIIFDTAGSDTLKFGKDISEDNLIFKRVNTDIIVGLKEEGVTFESLKDKVTLAGWYNFDTRIETFMFSDGNVMETTFLDAATEQDDYLIRGYQNDSVDALGGNDTVYAGAGNDTLVGGGGDDLIYGETGDDTLDGGTGNDTLQGGQGNDIYRFGRGDGHDVFDDYSNNGNLNSGNDVIQFKIGITQDDLLIKQIGNNLVIGIREEGKTFDELSDKTTIINWSSNAPDSVESWFTNDGRIESFTFADGTIWNTNDIVAHIGTDEDDAIYGLDGADTLHGGKGNDTLYGTGGNDTYIFNRGEGRDVVYDANYSYDAGNDTLKFGEGITVDDLIAQASINGNDLVIGFKEDSKPLSELSDTVTLRNWSNVNNRIENIVLFDGTTLDVNDVVKLQQTNGDDLIMGTEQNNTFEGKLGNDTIYGGAGNDTYVFNKGDGVDNVNDLSGKVYVRFGTGITTESIIVRAEEKNIIIALTEEGKSFDELSDKVILSNSEMMNIESIIFDNGKILSSADLINLESSEAQDTIVGTINNDTIDGGQGNDSLSGGAGNDAYIFNRGDGLDSIDDFSGADTLKLGQGISADDLILKAFSDNNNLIIALKEEGKSFSELSDTITIKNWFNTNNRIETIMFSDGSTISASTLIPLQGTNEDDTTHLLDTTSAVTLDLQEGNDTLTTSSGNDILIGGRGNDTLNGGAGNDIYVFNKGDGIDTIVDTNGMDVLRFGEGISRGNLIIHSMGSNLVIGLKEDGIAFENLTDKVTLVNWYKTANRIENFHFSDGTIVGSELATEFIGTNSADIMTTSDSGETIQGLDGDDTITALAGDDTLIGGKGNDTLQGGAGNDVYSFNRGNGSDIVIETSGNDTLAFGEGIISDDLIAQVRGNDLIIALKEEGKMSDKVTISNWYSANSRIETIAFSDGSSLNTTSAILGLLTSNEDDTITGTEQPDTINSGNGSDTINAGNGNDTLYGGAGNDILIADNDNIIYQEVAYADVLIGGKDNDVLYGGAGNDTYIFNRGDGNDIIYDRDLGTSYGYTSAAYNAGNDTLKFGEGITSDDLIIKVSSSSMDLIVALKEDGGNLSDQITILNWFKVNERIENFAFVDGTILNIQQIINMQGTDDADSIHLLDYNTGTTLNLRGGNDIVSVTNGHDVIYAGDGDDTIYGGNGNDSIYGGSGNDTLIADANATYKDPAYNDILIGGLGNDSLQAGAGDDTYIFNRGDGVDVIYDNDQLYSYYNGYYNAGNDTLNFGEEIIADDLIAKVSGNNLIIALKEEGKTFAELRDKITITDWYNANNRIENISFSNRVSLTTNGILNLISTDSDDVIRGTEQSESFAGGKGNDALQGSDGNDTYLFNRGDGIDTISDTNGSDTLQFGVELTSGDILIKQVGNDLVVGLKEEGKTFDELSDKITITNWSYNQANFPESWQDYNSRYGIENFVFADGMAWTITDIITHIGTDEDDVIYGLDYSDTISGGKGNDTLYGRGNDDTYIFNRGDGQDTIYDEGEYDYYGDNDQIKLGIGISANDVILHKDGGNLVIALKEDGAEFDVLSDKITIQNWFNPNTRIEHLFLSNGSEIDLSYLLNPSEESDYLIYGSEDNTVDGLGGDDEIYTNEGNDTITGGKGYDEVYGGYGNDTYIFNRGDGQDWIYDDDYSSSSNGNIDTIRFGEGITQDDLIVTTAWTAEASLGRGNKILIIAIKEAGVRFEDLKDTIQISNWDFNTIERIEFSDGSVLSTNDIIALQSTDQDDIVIGTNYADTLNGDLGNDSLYGFDNNDILVGGTGNDTVYGGYGNDTYVFNRGDGQDTFYDEGSSYYGGEGEIITTTSDTLQFGNGITQDDLIIRKYGDDLIIALKEEGESFAELSDKIKLQSWYNSSNQIETFEFSDGTSISAMNIVDLATNIYDGSYEDEYISLGDENDIVHGFGGDDEIESNGGNDILYGDTGNDYIDGGEGDDVYIFNRGDSHDEIYDYLGNDTLRFGEGITAEDLIIQRSGNDIIIALKEEGIDFANLKDKIRLLDWYTSDDEKIENILLNDGTAVEIIPSNAGMATEDWDSIDLDETDNVIHTLGGDDEIYGNDGDDTLYGDTGDDYIDGGAGANTLIGGKGDDYFDDEGSGNDTYLYNRGDGLDTINDYLGNDTLQFGEGISADDLIIQESEGSLIVALKQEGVAFDDLTDKVTIYTWNNTDYTIENILLSDGTAINVAELAAPIVFDLNNNGITSTSIEGNTVYFDYNADGLRERTGWIERGDALLSVDLNHDGIISNGSELFGDHTKLSNGSLAADGYAAMVQYDSNNDGKIDSSDTKFNDLLLWKDTNLDGQSSADELSTLAVNGIKSIDLSSNPLNITENGNRISYETSFSMASGVNGIVRDLWFKTAGDDTIKSTDGEIADAGSFSDSFDDFTTDTTLEIDSIKSFSDSGIGSLTLQSRYTGSGLDGASAQTVFEGIGYTGTLSNVWLKSDTLDTQYTYNGILSDDVKALPSISGQGNVINLQEAMNEKSELASSVSEFQNLSETGNLADFEANIDTIIEGWALYDLSGESANSTPPIVLDLDGDGATSTSLNSSSAYFDYDGDGRREHTAWSDAGDALLAIDLDADGVITHGAEVFGNYTMKADGTKATDGYDAMAQYDTNGDNVLDASDTEFSKLKLWKDANQNGKNDEGELSSLTQNGISAINLSRTDGTTFTQTTEAGNAITQETNYTGSANGAVRDVWFSYDGTDTIAYSNLSDADEKKIAIVENFYGRRLNSEERNSVEVIAEVLNQYNALRYDTIAKIITDKLYGEGFPNCQFLHDALNNTLGRVIGGAASTTETLLAVNLLAALLKREHVGVLSDIYPEYFSNPTIAGLLAQSNIAIGFEEGALIGHIGNRYFGTSLAETLDFSALDGVRAYMSGGDDSITGTNGIDELVGGEGNDTLDGNSGNDILEGGQGDDTLIGASTQNVYRYAWGDGNDTIIDAGSDDYAPDTLRFSDLDISRVSIERIGDDMIIHVRDEEGELLSPFDEAFGTITIKNGYSSGKIEHFYFKDQRYTFDEVLAYVPADTDYYFVQGDAHVTIDEKGGDDTLHFGEGITKESIIARIVGNDLIIGLDQEGKTFDTLRDKLTILNYTDAIEQFTFQDGTTMNLDNMIELAMAHLMINGNDASETLYGGSEGEIFNAAAGDDTIYGEAGDDTYKFGLGDGHDAIIDTAGKDTILLKEGVLANDVTLALDGEDLILSLSDGSKIRVVSWLSATGRIEHIKDSKGVSVDFSSVLKPVVENTAVEGNEDTLLEGSINVTDISGTPLVYAITTDPQYGTVKLNNETGEWTYEPDANFNGDDSVVVSVTNGYGVTSTSTITLNIASVNDAPIIEGEDIAVTLRNVLTSEGQINAQDVDGDTLSYSIETQASHGTLSMNDSGKWLYTTVDGYDGQDSATVRVSDNNGGSIDKILNFTIIDNSVPEAPLESSNVLQDIRILSGEVNATDVDGDMLSYTVSTEASHGILSVDENGVWNYSAANEYMGADTAVITIDDANGGVITQTLNFNVQVSAPSLANALVNLFEDTSSTGTFNVTNPIGGTLVYEVLNASSKGVFAIDEQGNWNYNPTANLNGEDSVTIKVTNSYGLSTTATLNLAIEAVNDAPMTAEQENYILQDIRIMNGVIEASDIDGDTLEYIIHTAPVHGEIHINAEGKWSYIPTDLYIGSDSVVIGVSDTYGGIVNKTIIFDNRVSTPSFDNKQLSLSEDTTINDAIVVVNPIGGTLSYEVINAASNGQIILSNEGSLEYTPNSNYYGNDMVTIKVTNEYGLSAIRTVAFNIQSVNDVPEAPSEVTNTLQDIRALSGEVGASDIDGDVLSYTVSTAASHGTLNIDENGAWSYTATDGYMGTDSAVVEIDDGNGGVVTQTLNFDVKVSAPTLTDSTSNILEDTNTTGTLSVLNPIGGALVYEVLNASTKGAFSVNEAGEWSYISNANLNGADSVTIKVTNAYGLSTTATLNLAIEAVNDAPILTETPAQVTLNAGTSATGNIKASDVDRDVLSYSITANPNHGTLSIDDQGRWNYTAERYYAGESSATLTIDDGHGESVTTTLNFANLMTPDWHYTYSNQHLTINDNNGTDVLMMNTISMSELTFLQEGNNLRIDVKDKNDVILTDYFTSPTKGVESLQTKEGMINLSKERIGTIGNFWNFGWGSNKADLISGKSSADTIYAGEGNDVIFGNAGNDALSGSNDNDLLIGGEGHDTLSGGNNDDILYGDNGNDTLSGEAGNDKLFGDKGNDTLSGGEGNDLLNGGEGTNSLSGSSGNDTYLFTKGANDTTINENMFGFNLFGRWIGQNGGNDTVKFADGISKEDISFLMKGNDLLIQYGDSEFITINNQKNQTNRIERLQLDDGSYLSNTDIDRIVQQINVYSKDHGFHLKDNTQIQNNQALMNIVEVGWHSA